MERINQKLIGWASVLEEQTRDQATTTATLPFIHPHIALMPDAHLGLGPTVGSVIPTRGAVIPAAVGVDIGCGMIAVRTQFTAQDLPRTRRVVRESIERAIPLGAGRTNRAISLSAAERIDELEQLAQQTSVEPERYLKSWRDQLGTLGSGNHFIEICLDEDDRVWTFLHSGSRGVGNKIAQNHIGVAKRFNAQAGVDLPDRELAYLDEGTEEFDAYIRDLRWAQEFARLNREEMMDRLNAQLSRWIGTRVEEQERVNCHHNFTELETHFGEKLWITRKGAISARSGEAGLIPGSMGTASYVVTGRGNPVSFTSAPHGAGRALSRRAARKKFGVEDLRASMTGIEYRDTSAFIDEIPAAYKPIDQVMADSQDLVSIRHTLRQIVNVKGE